jgi:hypothetical protein
MSVTCWVGFSLMNVVDVLVNSGNKTPLFHRAPNSQNNFSFVFQVGIDVGEYILDQ